MAKKKHLHALPTAVCFGCPLTFIITFIVAWQKGHVCLLFPYISDTGNSAPESCIFSQFLNITSMLLALCVYIRYLQVEKFANFKTNVDKIQGLRANKAATIMGFLSCLGMDIVANFQVENVKPIHYIGAFLCFVGGTIYFIFQTIFSYYLSKKYGSRLIFYIRSIFCVISVVMTFTALVPGYFSEDPKGKQQWCRRGTSPWHLISTISEWLLALSQCALVLTFLPEFRNVHLHTPTLKEECCT